MGVLWYTADWQFFRCDKTRSNHNGHNNIAVRGAWLHRGDVNRDSDDHELVHAMYFVPHFCSSRFAAFLTTLAYFGCRLDLLIAYFPGRHTSAKVLFFFWIGQVIISHVASNRK